MRTLVREPAWNTTRQRARQVFAESAICGWALGAGTAGTVTLVLVAGNTENGGAAFAYPLLASGFGGTLGAIVGLLAGVGGLWFVRIGEPRFGARTVALLLPIVGLWVSLPIALLLALPGGANWRAFVLCVAFVLSLTGSAIVAYRYLRRAEWPSVH